MIIVHACTMIIVHAYTMIIVHAHPVSTNHMISIVVNDQFKTVKIFDTLCLPLLPDMTQAKKVDQMPDTFEKVKKSIDFVREGRTSMSPCSNEIAILFEKLQMYLAFCMVLRHLKSRKKVCKNNDTCETFKKK